MYSCRVLVALFSEWKVIMMYSCRVLVVLFSEWKVIMMYSCRVLVVLFSECKDINDGCRRLGRSRPASRCYRKHTINRCCETCQKLRNDLTPSKPASISSPSKVLLKKSKLSLPMSLDVSIFHSITHFFDPIFEASIQFLQYIASHHHYHLHI